MEVYREMTTWERFEHIVHNRQVDYELAEYFYLYKSGNLKYTMCKTPKKQPVRLDPRSLSA